MMRIDQSQITEDDIGFSFTPRINAASRMGKPMDAFNLLSSTDVSEAGAYASHLDSINNERKGVVASMVKEIKKIIREREDVLRDVIVLGNPDWKPSLLGLVANSFSDEHNRPVFLWGREGAQVYKGSCRSGNGISVMDLMTEAQHALLDFGGHKEAGGFSVSLDNIHTLEDALNDAYSRLATDTVQEHIHIDKDIDLDEVSAYLFNDISRLSPFGVGNERPLFRARQAKISSVKLFGKEKNHLEIVFHRKKYRPIQAIAFFKKPESFNVSLDSDASVDIIFHIEKTMFRNFSEIRLRIVDIVPSL
jgi:single-stranded-DNA-specific exonuclease